MKLWEFRKLTKDLDASVEVNDRLLNELEESLVQPAWTNGRTVWDNASLYGIHESLHCGYKKLFNELVPRPVDSWSDQLKEIDYKRLGNGRVLVYHKFHQSIQIDEIYELEQKMKGEK